MLERHSPQQAQRRLAVPVLSSHSRTSCCTPRRSPSAAAPLLALLFCSSEVEALQCHARVVLGEVRQVVVVSAGGGLASRWEMEKVQALPSPSSRRNFDQPFAANGRHSAHCAAGWAWRWGGECRRTVGERHRSPARPPLTKVFRRQDELVVDDELGLVVEDR